jgi:hypothetical protein
VSPTAASLAPFGSEVKLTPLARTTAQTPPPSARARPPKAPQTPTSSSSAGLCTPSSVRKIAGHVAGSNRRQAPSTVSRPLRAHVEAELSASFDATGAAGFRNALKNLRRELMSADATWEARVVVRLAFNRKRHI